MILGSLYILWFGGELKPKENKIVSLTPLTILPLIQSHFRWTLSIPVIVLGLSLLYVPGNNWMNPSISPKGPKWDWINPNIV